MFVYGDVETDSIDTSKHLARMTLHGGGLLDSQDICLGCHFYNAVRGGCSNGWERRSSVLCNVGTGSY
jgi:hypothetical protein